MESQNNTSETQMMNKPSESAPSRIPLAPIRQQLANQNTPAMEDTSTLLFKDAPKQREIKKENENTPSQVNNTPNLKERAKPKALSSVEKSKLKHRKLPGVARARSSRLSESSSSSKHAESRKRHSSTRRIRQEVTSTAARTTKREPKKRRTTAPKRKSWDIKGKLEDAMKANRTLKETMKELRDELEHSKTEVSELTETLNNMEDQYQNTLYESEQQYKQAYESAKTKFEMEMKSKREAFNEDYHRTKRDLEEKLSRSKSTLEEEMSQLKRKYTNQIDDMTHHNKREIERYERDLEDSKSRFTREVDDMKNRYERELELERSTSRRRIEELESSLRSKTSKVEQLEERLRDVEDKLRQSMEDKLHMQKENMLEMQKITSEMTQKTSQYENRIANQQQKYDQTISKTRLQSDSQLGEISTQLRHYKEISQQRYQRNVELEQQLNEALEKVKHLENQQDVDEITRRRLHNQIQELKGNIRVYARVRPKLSSETDDELQNLLQVEHMQFPPENDKRDLKLISPKNERYSNPEYHFQFDRCFPPSSKQEEIFEEISQLVQSALDGYKVCIFAYGQTGSGKTFTMQGSDSNSITQDSMIDENFNDTRGMIPRSVEKIFEVASHLKSTRGWEFKVQASFLEIYNNQLKDLLLSSNSSDSPAQLDIVHDSSTKMTRVQNLSYIDVDNVESINKLLNRAAKNRSVAATNCNEQSSRSHSVFQLHIHGYNPSTQQKTVGELNLIDLAGSERLRESQSEGQRLKETQSINSSLSTLGKVISHLGMRSRSKKKVHIPFRDSKLTYLLQYALGGDAKTLMFVNISPNLQHFHESLCSLRFAAKVNNTQIGSAKKRQSFFDRDHDKKKKK